MSSRLRYTPEDDALLRELVESGITYREVAEEFASRGRNHSSSSLRDRATKYLGVKSRIQADFFHATEEQKEWLRAYIPGHTQDEIAEAFYREYGVLLGKWRVKNLKHRLGVRSGTVNQWTKENHPCTKGMTQLEIMGEEGVRKWNAWVECGSCGATGPRARDADEAKAAREAVEKFEALAERMRQ